MDRTTLTLIGLVALVLASGCATSGESANADQLTTHVGVYSPAPPGLARPRVGVPPFMVDGEAARGEKLDALAADQLTSLALNSGRFVMIERAQLEQLLREQGLEGMVRPEEMASMGEVRGVDYLMFGKVTNLRIKVEEASRGFGLGRISAGQFGNVGGFDYKKRSKKITVDCGVDLRLVNPTSGEIAAAHFGEYQKTDFAEAFGVDVLGANAEASADMKLDEDNKGKILRLALDEALRKMLPRIDQALLAQGPTAQPSTPVVATPAGEVTPSSAETPKFCSQCGGRLPVGARFCADCGNKLD